jgi:hypothetical protein
VARQASPARLLIALAVAAVLAIFLLYTSIAGGGNPSISPSELPGRTGKVQLAGTPDLSGDGKYSLNGKEFHSLPDVQSAYLSIGFSPPPTTTG